MTKIATKIQKATEMEARRARLAQLVMDGETSQVKLGKLVAIPGRDPLSAKTISQDMKAIRAEWSKLRVRCFDTDFGREYQRLEREYRRWLRAWQKSCGRKRVVKRQYETQLVTPAVEGSPEILTDDGTLIREEIPGTPAVYARVEVERTVTYEQSAGDARYAALVAKTSESIRTLLGLLDRSKDTVAGVLPVVGFVINPPPGYVPRGMVPIENQVIETVAEGEAVAYGPDDSNQTAPTADPIPRVSGGPAVQP